MINFESFPKIHNFQNFIKNANKLGLALPSYNAKPKLHGTNARIMIRNGEWFACSKSRVLSKTGDNAEFWAECDRGLGEAFTHLPDCNVYGEWCGQGIQKGVSVSLIPKKTFFIFLVEDISNEMLYINPTDISYFLKDAEHDQVKILPWVFTEAFDLTESGLKEVEETVNIYDNNDPYIHDEFGLEGVGEGVVMYPFIHTLPGSLEKYKSLFWKAKGAKHSVSKVKAFKAKKFVDCSGFANNFLTEARYTQILDENGLTRGCMTDIGVFLRNIILDIKSETEAELEESGFVWKEVQRYITLQAKAWFTKRKSVL